MGAYSFKAQFVPYILDGSKTHTIRGKRKYSDKPGSVFHGFHAMRTKQCRKLIEAPVVRVQDFRMERARVWIDGEELDLAEKDLLAWRDGFRWDGTVMTLTDPPLAKHVGSFNLMLQFWSANHGTTDFDGHLIHWDYQRRVVLAESAHV